MESDGYSLVVGHRWDNLLARVSYHYNDAKVNGVDANAYVHNGIANTVEDTLTAQLDYQLNSQWNFGWKARFVQGRDGIELDQSVYPDAEVDQPGFGIHDYYA